MASQCSRCERRELLLLQPRRTGLARDLYWHEKETQKKKVEDSLELTRQGEASIGFLSGSA